MTSNQDLVAACLAIRLAVSEAQDHLYDAITDSQTNLVRDRNEAEAIKGKLAALNEGVESQRINAAITLTELAVTEMHEAQSAYEEKIRQSRRALALVNERVTEHEIAILG